jgi:hypothetical protein
MTLGGRVWRHGADVKGQRTQHEQALGRVDDKGTSVARMAARWAGEVRSDYELQRSWSRDSRLVPWR